MNKPSDKSSASTPLMRQYYAVKEKHPDKILFFRMGDFYEMFGDDAVKAAPILGIALTSRSHGAAESIPLAGVPYHAADRYLAKLLSSGQKVVVVEQVEDPRTAKGIVKREIVEILTPGTATFETEGFKQRPQCLVAVCENKRGLLGLAALDMTTGTFTIHEGEFGDAVERLKVLDPSEIIFPCDVEREEFQQRLGLTNGASMLTEFGEWNFDFKTAERDLNEHFGTATLEGFGVADQRLGVSAAGAILRYLKENHREHLSHIDKISGFDDSERMALDFSTVRNLELVENIARATQENSLLSVIDRCQTAAGTRRLRAALLRPFKTKQKIDLRLGGVSELVKNREMAFQIRRHTRLLTDIEMLAGRLGLGKLNPRQMKSVKEGLLISKVIRELLTRAESVHLGTLGGAIPDNEEIIARIGSALSDDPPQVTNKGEIFRPGYSERLDALNDSIRDARQYIAGLQAKERERTGITNLRVGFNKVFGYYIEITRSNLDAVPDDYIRKQTLVNAERYITPELKEKEELILNAEEKIFRLEQELYQELMEYLNGHISDIKITGDILAEVDLVSALAELAVENGYCRPEIYEDTRLNIVSGRHPVIEAVLPPGTFVANDVSLSGDSLIHILTGPNMSGKSTYLRQIGLIVILAQVGSYVPAGAAEIGLVDRVFTRVGALDNLARGQSTFLVEMIETANILHNATDQSLVLLDEVGRGTSTFDGLSVAWAVVEHINEAIQARTVFATHYHELTGMAEIYEKVHNYQVAVKKWESKVIFLHQIIPGGCDDSYGIEVAKLAGLPKSALGRARQILKLLESGKFTQSELGKGIYKQKVQPTLFDARPSAIEQTIKDADLDHLTPIDALNLLRQLKDDME
ncbi:MAG: DNA mismatch repair protein MutS [Candidatus Zixiibacteriota bacterium]